MAEVVVSSVNANQSVQQRSQRPKRFKSRNEWRSYCQEIQSVKITPEIRAQMQEKRRRKNKLRKKAKRANNYVRSAKIGKMAWAQGNARMLRSAPAEYETSAMKSNMQMQQLQRCYAAPAHFDESDDEAEEEYALQLDCIEAEQAQDEIGQVDETGMSQLLQSLAREPKNDQELAAKFALYEEFLKTVEQSRKAAHDFWADCKEDFEEASGNVVKQIEKELKAVDSAENMGIDFNQRRWFVYDMTVKADSNNGKLEEVLKVLQRKLDMLAANDDCPFCLEAPAADNPFVTLACCHKACEECWGHWQAEKGHAAFCPLCRENDFLVNLMQMN